VQDDTDVIRKFQQGEESAFNDLVRKYQKQIYLVIRRMVGIHEEAEDLSQEVFIRAYHGLQGFRGDASFLTWIYRIAVNLTLNHLRKKKLRQILSLENIGLTISSRNPTPEQCFENHETEERLARAIERLPKKQKLVFNLRYFHKLPHAEIASILNRDVGTIKANYHQAIRKLQREIKS
jgi:RNA polymerase sigma-70 factor (ECF subfamily)